MARSTADKRVLIGFYGDGDLRNRLQERARREDRSMSSLLRTLVEAYLVPGNSGLVLSQRVPEQPPTT